MRLPGRGSSTSFVRFGVAKRTFSSLVEIAVGKALYA